MSADLRKIVAFMCCLVLGEPVLFSLGIGWMVEMLTGLSPSMLATLGTNNYYNVAKYPLMAIPLFILTGLIFERAGVAASLVRFAQAIIGPGHGGLTLVAVMVCIIMGGMSGCGLAHAAAVAMVMLCSLMRGGCPHACLG